MQLPTVLVIVSLICFQDAFSQAHNADDVRQAIARFRNASNTVLEEGTQLLKSSVAEIEVLSFAVVEIGFIKINASLASTNKQVDLELNKGVYVTKCVHEARANLSSLIKNLSKLINNCGENARHEINIVNDILNYLSIDINLIIDNYYENIDVCIEYKNETCFNKLLTGINENSELYPKELSARLNLTSTSLEDIKTDLGKCIANTDDKASFETKKIVNNMSECIRGI
ncbi:PREDICTED: uncharacterized protein LOC108562963 [Nicrophorus vespilloides]|uniref:Uncharacterized protein LOC108562963 n=1 Tax=Nicrophorus vespilloides TaxID=110193 RepID=A0ABM1MQW6_NICVS|nr:PREDICTED: uncharacterized protein LOC108562963 [Nicrophorus vespilloides]